MAANDSITVRLRLADSKRFQAEAASSAAAVEGIGKRGAKSVTSLSTRLETMSGRMHRAGRAATMGLTLPILGIGAAAYKAFNDVDAGMDAVTAGTGASGAALQGLHDSFRRVAGTVNQDMGTTGQVLADLNTRTGATGRTLETMARQTLEASRMLGGDAVESVRTMTRAMNDWGIAAKDGPAFMDRLFVASQKTGIGISELAGQMSKGGVQLRSMGFSMDETIALLSKFEKEGVRGELIVNSLRQGLARMAKEGVEDPAQAFAKLTGEIKNAGSAGAAINKAVEVFGSRAGPDMALAIREGRLEIGELVRQLGGSTGAIMSTADQTVDGSDRMARAMNNAKLQIAPLGEAISGALGSALEAVGPKLEKVGRWLGEMSPNARRNVLVIGALVAGLGPLLRLMGWWFGGLGKLVRAYQWLAKAQIGQAIVTRAQTIAAMVSSLAMQARLTAGLIAHRVAVIAGAVATGVMTAAQWALNVAMRANPVGLLLTGLTLLAAGFVWAYQKVGWFRNLIQAVWGWLKVNGPKILGFLLTPTRVMVAGVVAAWGKIKSAASSVVGFIKNRFNDVVGFFRGLPGRITRAASGLWNGIKDAFRGALNWIIGKWNSFELGFGPVKVPGLPDIPRMAIGTPNIPELAEGGTITRGGWGITGEKGPELLNLPRAAEVQPLPAGAGAFMDPGAAAAGGRDDERPIVAQFVLDGHVFEQVIGRRVSDRLARR